MKVLSIQQPWAWAIVNGFKDIENRTWETKFRGEFYVHSSKRFDTEGYEFIQEAFPYIELPEIDEFAKGGIVGKAKLIDIVDDHCSPWFFGPLGFVLAEQIALPFVPCKGKLGFFEEPKCRVCGCTNYNACPGGCTWVYPDFCSNCTGEK